MKKLQAAITRFIDNCMSDPWQDTSEFGKKIGAAPQRNYGYIGKICMYFNQPIPEIFLRKQRRGH